MRGFVLVDMIKVKRPYLYIGVSPLIASFLLFYLGALIALGFIVVSSLVMMALLPFDKKSLPRRAIFLVLFLLFAVRIISISNTIENTNKYLVGKTVKVEAVITNITYEAQNYSRYNIQITQSPEEKAKGVKLNVSARENAKLSVGDRIDAEIQFLALDNLYKASNYSNGIYYGGEIENYSISNNKTFSVYTLAGIVRKAVKNSIKSAVSGDEAAVLSALTIGDKSDVSDRLYRNVRLSGVSHMLVVSGMHLGILCGALAMFLKNYCKNQKVATAIGILSAVFIAIVCLFHTSILRAGITYIVFLLGTLLRRNSDSLNSLGFAITLMVFALPYIIYNVAFMLSVTATFAVICPADMLIKTIWPTRVRGVWKKTVKSAGEILIISACATICTLPVIATYYNYVTWISPLTNLLANAPVTVGLVVCVVAVIISLIPFIGKFLSIPLFFISDICAKWFIAVVNAIGESGIGTADIGDHKNIYCFLIAAGFILLVRAVYLHKSKERMGISNAKRQNP